MNGGRFDFDDGGTYCGGWEEGKAHAHGVCTGPQGKGEYAGAWHYGFEVSGVYTWPSGNTYAGQWQNGKRHGLGVEHRGRWLYRGEWTGGYKGRYGVRQSTASQARYMGTWSAGLHDGYGTEIYVDGGSYQGQWLRGMRHGYGVRKSAAFGQAAKWRAKSATNASLTSLRSGRAEDEEDREHPEKSHEGRGGFVLRAHSAAPSRRRRSLSERSLAVKRSILSGLRIKKQHSTGDIHQRVTSLTGSLRSSGSTLSCASDDSLHKGALVSPEEEAIEEGVTECYSGEWKNDSRSGFGVCERSDGLKYEGEWLNNAKCGHGVTTFKDGSREEGKYKNNVLVTSTRKKGVLFVRSSRLKERIEASVEAAVRAAQIAHQKADIAASRTSTAKERAEQAMLCAQQAKEDSHIARIHAKQFDPNFRQPGTEGLRRALHSSHEGEDAASPQPPSLSQRRQPSTEQPPPPPSLLPNQVAVHVEQHVQLQHPLHPAHNALLSQTPLGVSTQSPLGVHPPSLLAQQQPLYASLEDAETSCSLPNSLPNHHPHPAVPSLLDRHSTDMKLHEEASGSRLPAPQPLGNSTAQSSSRMSLSDDHFDQYVMAGNPAAARLLRRNRPSLTRQPDNVCDSSSQMLNRRSTLASAADRRAPRAVAAATTEDWTAATDENMGSLPNLAELESQGVRLRREEAARLASQRRQEILRNHEEEALLRANPLRYLVHPAFRAWLVRWKVPLLLVAANLVLLLIFYHLLTYEKRRR